MSQHVVFIVGEAEYQSQVTMPPVAAELADRFGLRTTICTSSPIEDGHALYEFEGLEALEDADALVVYTRFRVLSDPQMGLLQAYLDSGGPVVGLRTSTHSFRFPEGSPWHSWNNGFGIRLFGTPWRTHHGGQSSTDVRVLPEAAGHPILEGVAERFHVRSWLYHVLPLPDTCEPLLWGIPVNAAPAQPMIEKPTENPVAWTNTHNGGRVFYTSLGHPEDFQAEPFRRLLVNGILWALGRNGA